MSEQWPATLQQCLSAGSFSQTPQDTNITTAFETGPPKIRRRFTTPVMDMVARIWIAQEDFATLENFFYTTLQGGTQYFEFTNPLTLQLEEWRFKQPYVTTYLGGTTFVIDMLWERNVTDAP